MDANDGEIVDRLTGLRIGLCEDVEWAGDIQKLNAGKGENCDVSGDHAASVAVDVCLMAENAWYRQLMPLVGSPS
ncbi:hypothetical protein OKC48_03155 [Methylorubrum extorquens]|uniref:hypothetical protein n=1 Tax=Methylorubrum extorquens TaxID=408 RepID=UPI001EE57B13|nr:MULTISPECIES: hypothetical protein [Methylorubrum]UYW29711.1 hypothetical protein OKC48_03155 [Methylorubrum extorquens]